MQSSSDYDHQLVLYATDDGKVKLEVEIADGTVWLTQQQIAKLYGKAVSTINEHLKNIIEEKEISENDCIKKFGNSEFQQKAYLASLEAEAKKSKLK